jgi:NADH:ubiquinone oxidoreductase subunit 5 (subunit L)/multisubunit Na+/H+ antiporter MnhA subunit
MTFFPQALWCAWTLIVLGAVGALLGISLAMYQRDLKRTLAYSSIENVGLILLALGIGLVGVCRGDGRMAALGLLGGLFHVWNHVLMKGLMFLSAGSIVHGTGTRDLERMGGLMKRMPATSALMVFGAVAISGLPPLNGFASEWLIYLGLIQGGVHGAGARSTLILLLVGLLAFVGGLAVLCFVRIIGVALLGSPRAKLEAHESSPWMTGPMALLAAAAAVAALFPSRVLGLLAPVATQLGAPAGTLAPVAASTAWLGNGAALIWLSLGVLGLALALWSRRPAADQTWGCGDVAPTPRMQYTARSFTEVMAERLLPSILGPRVRRKPPEGIFPSSGEWSAESDDPVMRSVYEPFLDRWARRFSQLRWLQQGVLHVYILYILVVLLAALGWMSARNWSFS